MRKTILIFLFLAIYGFADAVSDVQEVESIIKQVAEINRQITIVKNKQKEHNSTMANDDFSVVIKKKNLLISSIPPLITSQKKPFVISKTAFQNSVRQLEKKIDINRKAKYQNAVLRDSIALDKLQAKKIFFNALNDIITLSRTSEIDSSFDSIIQEAQLSLKAISLPIINHINEENLRDYSYTDLLQDNENTKATINAYLQVMEYLDTNSNLLRSNYMFERLDVDNIINMVNSIMPFQSKYINIGKLMICIFILIFFEFLRHLLRKRNFIIFVSPFRSAKYTDDAKKAIIKTTNRPLLALLFVIGVKLCVNILYYPYAVSPVVATAFSITYIIIFAWFTISVSNGYGIAFVNSMAQQDDPTFRKEVANLILKIFYFLVITIALMMILSLLGVNVSAIIASLGIGGLAVAWAAKDVLANFFASVLLLIDNSFSQGDWIECAGVEGTVVEIGLRRTTVRSFDNAMLFVPNSTLANEPIRNWSRRKVGRRIKMEVGITYGASKESLENCVKQIREMLLSHPNIAKPSDTRLSPKDYKLSFKEHIVSIEDLKGYKRTLLVYLDNFGDSSINILVYCFSQSTNWESWLKIKEDVMLKIMDIVEQNGLDFAFPSQSLYVESLPKNELKDKLLELSDKKESE